jgi:sulfoxide reductase heme-binding subunit YedZ
LRQLPWLRIVVHLGAWAPLALIGLDALRDNLTANWIQAITFRTGKPALVLLVLSLACTPLASVFGFKAALKVRRALGLYAFMYAALHFAIFVGLDYGFDLALIWETVLEKRYLIVGAGALLILLPLAITSFQWWMKRLGKAWKRLHKLAYIAGLLAVSHYVWVVKTDVREPLAWGAFLVLLLGLRVTPVKKAASQLWQWVQSRFV